MDIFKQGMKGPARPAPSVPGFSVNRYSPVTNWNDDPFGADVFEPTPNYGQKKKPPPRPPPPKVNKQPDIPAKPSHFLRRPTVLTSLLSRKPKNVSNQSNKALQPDLPSEIETVKMFPRCEPKVVNTGALIDLSSPPSSPTFTTRSSSDGLSVDSFGSDATTSTNHHHAFNGGSVSQAESGFEDDFELFLHSRKAISKEDTLDDFSAVDPFSPQPVAIKPPIMKKPDLSKDLFDVKTTVPALKGPTIIRAKPARPKPPDSTSILKNSLGNTMPAATMMNLNTTVPIQKVNGFSDFEPKWDDHDSSPEREESPPMPSIPPPPPPPIDADEDLPTWPDEVQPVFLENEPYAIALYDYNTGHPDDLAFTVNTRVKLIRRENEEWLYGKLDNGAEGLFPSNFVEIKIPLPNDKVPETETKTSGTAVALYDFIPDQTGDLRFVSGDHIKVLSKINDEWYFGECNGMQGQFPVTYVQMNL